MALSVPSETSVNGLQSLMSLAMGVEQQGSDMVDLDASVVVSDDQHN